MPALCLCFTIHEPYQLRRYTVFDMGQSSVYEDDDRNCEAMLRAARQCYLPACEMLLKLVRRFEGAFVVSLCISGTALDLFEQYTPEVTESLCALAATGCVEFVAETSAHSLAFLYSREEFDRQVKAQNARLKKLFGKKPTAFMHTECVFNNDLAAALQQLGFKTALAQGTDHVLGWRSPNWVYRPVSAPKMQLLLRNAALSDDMGLRFGDSSWSGWPLTADKYASWLHSLAGSADVINIFNDIHLFGLRHAQDSGIFDFMAALPEALLADSRFSFVTPSALGGKLKPAGEVDVPQFMSWEDNGNDLTSWLGNDMQKDAIHALYSLAERIRVYGDKMLLHDYERLQTADHFRYMSTRWFTGPRQDRPNPFDSPYDAYITYMNVLADLELRLDAAELASKARKISRASRASRSSLSSGTGASV